MRGQHQFVLCCAGGGSGAVAALVQTPGASRVVLEAVVPYSLPALTEWLGATPGQACSAATARAMAMAAWQRARRLARDRPPEDLLGVACTASLASDRPKRGEHRIHVAVQSSTATRRWSLHLERDARTRCEEEHLATVLLLDALRAATSGRELESSSAPLRRGERVACQTCTATRPVVELFCGRADLALCDQGQWISGDAAKSFARSAALFPGAFNPLHEGHRKMAKLAGVRLQRRIVYELAVANVDKPPLDFCETESRVRQFGNDAVLLTNCPTFVEKARLLPGAPLVVGADTVVRIAEAKYYGGVEARNAAIAELAELGVRFLVFGRATDQGFQTLSDLHLPQSLAAICDGVSADDFRDDVSSTALRSQSQ